MTYLPCRLLAALVLAVVNTAPTGIFLDGLGRVARNNRVRGLEASGNGSVVGIFAPDAGTTVDGSQLIGSWGVGIEAGSPNRTACSNNVVAGFSHQMVSCVDAGNNITLNL